MTKLNTWRIDLHYPEEGWVKGGKCLDLTVEQAEAMYKRMRDQGIERVDGIRLVQITEHAWEARVPAGVNQKEGLSE